MLSVILRDEIRLARRTFIRPKRHHRQCLGKRLARDGDAAGVYAGLPNASFNLLGYAENLLLRLIAVLIHLTKLCRTVKRSPKRHPWLVGNKSRKFVGDADWILQCARHVLYRTPWSHLSESDDVGYVVAPVFVAKIFDNLPTPSILKINVDVRH